MKPYLSSAPLLLLASCRPDQPTGNAAAPQLPAAALATTSARAALLADPLHVADSLGHRAGILPLRPSTDADFAKLPARPSNRESPSNGLGVPLPAAARGQRPGERRVLHPAQGAAVTLKPVPSPDGPAGNGNAYHHRGSLPQVHQWMVDVATNEGSGVLLLVD